jgi:hypothetical protein
MARKLDSGKESIFNFIWRGERFLGGCGEKRVVFSNSQLIKGALD